MCVPSCTGLSHRGGGLWHNLVVTGGNANGGGGGGGGVSLNQHLRMQNDVFSENDVSVLWGRQCPKIFVPACNLVDHARIAHGHCGLCGKGARRSDPICGAAAAVKPVRAGFCAQAEGTDKQENDVSGLHHFACCC